MALRVSSLLAAVMITFTAPRYDGSEALSTTRGSMCNPDSVPVSCTDLDHFNIYGVRRAQQPQQIQRLDGRGREGQKISFTPLLPDHPTEQWGIFITSVDTTGNESCWSNMATINGTVSVDDPPLASDREEWFDVAGRKLHARPRAPGVYICRRGIRKHLTIILQ